MCKKKKTIKKFLYKDVKFKKCILEKIDKITKTLRKK